MAGVEGTATSIRPLTHRRVPEYLAFLTVATWPQWSEVASLVLCLFVSARVLVKCGLCPVSMAVRDHRDATITATSNANILMCRQWWRACLIRGDQTKFYRQLYARPAVPGTIKIPVTQLPLDLDLDEVCQCDETWVGHSITQNLDK